MKPTVHLPETPAGAVLSNCDLDEKCAALDCDAVMSEFGDSLMENATAQDFLAHYCGLDYVEKLHGDKLQSHEESEQ